MQDFHVLSQGCFRPLTMRTFHSDLKFNTGIDSSKAAAPDYWTC